MSTDTALDTARAEQHPSAGEGRPANGRPAKGRAAELEGYRGIAALSIIAFHVFQYVVVGAAVSPAVSAFTSFEAVDVLFVLSAYLLTVSYARSAINRTPALGARDFLFRRAVRILPLYWIGVTVIWALRNPGLPGDWRDLLEHLTFTQVFDRKRIFYTLGPTWSMSLEIMFYGVLVLLGPLAVRACARIDSRRRRVALLAAGCGVLFLIPVVWNNVAYLGYHVTYDHWPVYFGPQARFGAFAVGMLLAVVVAARDGKPLFAGVWPTLVRLGALAVILGASLLNRPGSWGQVEYHDISALGWLLLLASTVLGVTGQAWARALSWRPLVLAGLISYSTYMWHEPIMQLLDHHGITTRTVAGLPWALTAVLVAAVLAGTLSYRVIEAPTGKLRALRTRTGAKRDYYPELEESG